MIPPDASTLAPLTSSPAFSRSVRTSCSACVFEGSPGTGVGEGHEGGWNGGTVTLAPGGTAGWGGAATAHPETATPPPPCPASVQGTPPPRSTRSVVVRPVTVHPLASETTVPSTPRARARVETWESVAVAVRW